MDDRKYYWLKLKRDFFKRHDIRIVEEMPNGKEYILFYLKLLCESIDHNGSLRFSDEIPYNENMLSVITNTNIDVVRNAVKLFTDLKMMDFLDDGTIFMREVDGMIGSAANNDNANRQRKFREKKKAEQNTLPLQSCYESVTKNNESKSIELDTDKEKDNKRKRFIPPTLEEIKAYCNERKSNVDAERFFDYYESNGWMVGKTKMKDWKAAFRSWERNNFSNQKKQNVEIPVPNYIKDQINGIEEKSKVDYAWLDKYK